MSVVGAGGKTSLVHELAAEAAGRGLSVIITTTTKFTKPAGTVMPEIVEASDAEIVERLGERLRPGAVLVASAGRGNRGRYLGFEPSTVDRIAGELRPGLLAVEADGSAHRPFKAPAEHEPAIVSTSTHVIVCVGLEVLSRPLDARHVHRPEVVRSLAEGRVNGVVTPDLVIEVLTHELGGRKDVPPGARLSALLNNPVTPEHERLGLHIAQRLVYSGYHRAVVANAHRRDGVRGVVR